MAKKKKMMLSRRNVSVAKKKAEQTFRAARSKLLKAETNMKRYVEKNPRKAAAIAAGIGVAVGAAVAAAMRKKR